MFEKIKEVISKIKKEKPLILNLTNTVSMDFVANGLLSVGASPVMSRSREELEDLLKLANSLVINLGTLDEQFVTYVKEACRIANQLNKPIILDPVGAGASRYRTEISLQFIQDYSLAVIRGNASEIVSLAGVSGMTKGVDSTIKSDDAVEGARVLSKQFQSVVVVSGETDFIVGDDKVACYSYGSLLMPCVTGTGCLLSAVIGAFHAVEKNGFDASTMATVFYGKCGENAAKKSKGPASFKVNFLDELSLYEA